jgi:hypothetical protein
MLPRSTDIEIVVSKLICLEEVVHHILLYRSETQLMFCSMEGEVVTDVIYLLSLPVSECVQHLLSSLQELYPEVCVEEVIDIKNIKYMETHSRLDDDYIKNITQHIVGSIMNVENADNQLMSFVWLEKLKSKELVWEEVLCFLIHKLNRLFLKRVEETLQCEILKRGVDYERELMNARYDICNYVYEEDYKTFKEYAVNNLITTLRDDSGGTSHLFAWDTQIIQNIKMAIRAHCRIVSIQLVLEHIGVVFVHPNLFKNTIKEIIQNPDNTLQNLFKAFRGSKPSTSHEQIAIGLTKRLTYDSTKPSDIPVFKYTYSQYLSNLETRLMQESNTSSQGSVEEDIIVAPLKNILDHCIALHGQRFLCHMIRETKNDPPTTYSETSPYIRQDPTEDV